MIYLLRKQKYFLPLKKPMGIFNVIVLNTKENHRSSKARCLKITQMPK